MIPRHGTAAQVDLGLAILRVAAGVVFFMHGYQKFFMMGLDGVEGFFGGLGVPLPGVMAPFVATLELLGGALLILGFGTRLIAILLAFDMLTAIVLLHAKNGFFVPMGIEFVMMNMAAAIALALAGPGAPSVDRMLDKRGRTAPAV